MKLKPFYWNFDGLDVTFRSLSHSDLTDTLEAEN